MQALFLPIFFAYTGLRTDIGTIQGWAGFGMLMLVLAVAFGSKFGGAYLASRMVGENKRSALTIGVCMNTRALMELIVLNIGKDLGLLPTNIFSMLVIMAIASTFMATPLIRWLMRGEEKTGPVGRARKGCRRGSGGLRTDFCRCRPSDIARFPMSRPLTQSGGTPSASKRQYPMTSEGALSSMRPSHSTQAWD